jgi:hypothetical protein
VDRLNFRIPEFVRVAWVNTKAREIWEPIIQECSNFFVREIEGFNRTAIVNIRPEDMIGRDYIPLAQVNIINSYRAGSTQFDASQPWEYRCATGPQAEFLARAYVRNDWDTVGTILGYPKCCIDFFLKYWVDEKWFDTTYPMGNAQPISPANNILLRWVGVRLVSHLPCSFDCPGTMLIGKKNIMTARALGFNRQIDQIIEMLSWPVEWSSLHGIAIITTPIFKIITSSDALPFKTTRKLEGTRYPELAGSGLSFPFKRKLLMSQDARANGFSSKEAMDKAHQKILDTIANLSPRSVLDLGCGTGVLIGKIARDLNAFTYGVDSDASKYPDICTDVYDFEFERPFDLVLIAEQRTIENPERWKVLYERIIKDSIYLCIYNYNTGSIIIQDNRASHDNAAIAKGL